MPRRTTPHFLKIHHLLSAAWQSDQRAFSYLSYVDQRVLHDYYLFAIEISDVDLRAHRLQVTADQPSIPQRAGRALHRFGLAEAKRALVGQQYAAANAKTATGADHQMSVRAVLRPTLDMKLLTTTLLQLAEARARAKQDH